MENYQGTVTDSVQAYMVAHGHSQASFATLLGITQSALSRKLLGARAWSLADLDALEAAGVLSVEVRPQAVTA